MKYWTARQFRYFHPGCNCFSKGLSVAQATEKPNSVPILVSCLKRRAHKMCTKLQKQLHSFPPAHTFSFFGPDVVLCAQRAALHRVAPTRSVARGDELDSAAPCLQGFGGNFSAAAGDLLLKRNWPFLCPQVFPKPPQSFPHAFTV